MITWIVFGKGCTKVVPCDGNRACIGTRGNGSRGKPLFQAWGRGDIHAGKDSWYKLAETVLQGGRERRLRQPLFEWYIGSGAIATRKRGSNGGPIVSVVARVSGMESPTGRARSSEDGGSALVSEAGAGSCLIERSSRVRRRSSAAADGGVDDGRRMKAFCR